MKAIRCIFNGCNDIATHFYMAGRRDATALCELHQGVILTKYNWYNWKQTSKEDYIHQVMET
jgi:hypothetical protein